jgi:hypothetical protein
MLEANKWLPLYRTLGAAFISPCYHRSYWLCYGEPDAAIAAIVSGCGSGNWHGKLVCLLREFNEAVVIVDRRPILHNDHLMNARRLETP